MGRGSPAKNSARRGKSVASKAEELCAPIARAASARRSGLRPVRITSAPSARARRAVANPIPALPPITTTVCSVQRARHRPPLIVVRSAFSANPWISEKLGKGWMVS